MPDHSRKIKFTLILLIIVSLGAILSIFIHYRLMSSQPGRLLKAIQSDASVAINGARQTAMRDGIKEWTLEAESAFLIQEEGKAVFKQPRLVFFMENNDKVHLSADRGILWTDTNDLDIAGQVVVTRREYLLKTEKLHYKHKNRIIMSDSPVELSGDQFHFTADTLHFSLESNQTRLEGNVKGTLSGRLSL
jgi:LPS export ABC transporter protein LptC